MRKSDVTCLHKGYLEHVWVCDGIFRFFCFFIKGVCRYFCDGKCSLGTHIHTGVHICLHTHTRARAYKYTCMLRHTHPHTHAYTHTETYAYRHIHTQTYAYTNTYTYTRARTDAYTYTPHTNTRIHKHSKHIRPLIIQHISPTLCYLNFLFALKLCSQQFTICHNVVVIMRIKCVYLINDIALFSGVNGLDCQLGIICVMTAYMSGEISTDSWESHH